jgi:hypothetical protein
VSISNVDTSNVSNLNAPNLNVANTDIDLSDADASVATHKNNANSWEQQLAELAIMGFKDERLNIALLERYDGNTERVVNDLCEENSP